MATADMIARMGNLFKNLEDLDAVRLAWASIAMHGYAASGQFSPQEIADRAWEVAIAMSRNEWSPVAKRAS